MSKPNPRLSEESTTVLRSALSPVALPLILLAACASPAVWELEQPQAARLERVTITPSIEDVLALDALGASALRLPLDLSSSGAPGDFWRTAAYTLAASVRSARRRVLELRGERLGAGSPDALSVKLVDHEFGGSDDLIESVFAFDLLGHLGLGPSQTAVALSDARVLLALADYEGALFEAELVVERSRLELAFEAERLTLAAGLLEDAERDSVRFAVLEANGRLARTQADALEAALSLLRLDVARSEQLTLRKRTELASAAGLAEGHEQLNTVQRVGELDLPTPPVLDALDADAWSVLELHPELRRARVAFTVAEADVRSAARRAWPGIRLGPHLAYNADLAIGGVLGLDLPFPSAWRGALEAAEQRRLAAQEAYQDTVLALTNAAQGTSKALADWGPVRRAAAAELETASAAFWRATRARLAVGQASPEEWRDALEARRDTLFAELEELRQEAGLRLDLYAALGPASVPGAARLAHDSSSEGQRHE